MGRNAFRNPLCKVFFFIDCETQGAEYYQMNAYILDVDFLLKLSEQNNLVMTNKKTSFDGSESQDDLIITLTKNQSTL